MRRAEIVVRDIPLPSDAVPMARHELSTGACLDLTIEEWGELHAWLDLGQRCASEAELRHLDEIAP